MLICGQKERCKEEGTKKYPHNHKTHKHIPCITSGLQLEDILSVKLVEMGVAGLQLLLLRAFKWGTGGGDAWEKLKIC